MLLKLSIPVYYIYLIFVINEIYYIIITINMDESSIGAYSGKVQKVSMN